MIRRPPRSTLSSSSAASDVYKRQAGTPRYGASERVPMFFCPPGIARVAHAGNDDGAHPEVVQGVLDARFPVAAAVGGDAARIAAGSVDHSLNRGSELRGADRGTDAACGRNVPATSTTTWALCCTRPAEPT